LLFLTLVVRATDLGCLCGACWSSDDGTLCGYPGAAAMNSTNCDDCSADICTSTFPEAAATAVSVYPWGCQTVDTDSWAGEWDMDPCDNGCFYSPGMLGDCLPCCAEPCDCFQGNIQVTENGDGTMNMTIQTSHIPSTSYIVPHTGTAGYTATVNISGSVYDITKNGDNVQFIERLVAGTGYTCEYSLTRNPSTTNYLKLALLIAGVAVGALLLIVFLCCNPLKRCRKNKETKPTEGQPYKPLPSDPAEHANINYTGGGYNNL